MLTYQMQSHVSNFIRNTHEITRWYVFGDYTFKMINTSPSEQWVNTLRPRQNGRHFGDDTFKRIFMNENVRISINISWKFVAKGLINNIPALVQIMAWRRPGDKPLSEPMIFNLLTHICVTRHQWVNASPPNAAYMRQCIGSVLIQIMACCLFGARPLPDPVLVYYHLDSLELISVKLKSEFYHFLSDKCISNCRLPKWRPFYPGGDVFSHKYQYM